MSAAATLERSSRTLPAVSPRPAEKSSSPLAPGRTETHPASLETLSPHLAIAYRWVCRLGQRWPPFGRKFRMQSRHPNSNWVRHETDQRLADLRRMY
jgi:hypothetical protein